MITNLLKKYPELLDLNGFTEKTSRKSLYPVFKKDFLDDGIVKFMGKVIKPTPNDDQHSIELLYRHLTTVVTDKETKKREFETDRSIRLHWVKHHIKELESKSIQVFSVLDREGERTYIYNDLHKYVIVLEPIECYKKYYLLTAHVLKGRDPKKIRQKLKRKLPNIL